MFKVKDHIPAWLYKDKNGKAVAAAIEVGMQAMEEVTQAGVKLITDIDTAPEWRLDEIAWELDCPYDSGAPVEKKRQWIRLADEVSRFLGTRSAMETYLQAYDDSLSVIPWYEEGGSGIEYTFLVTSSDYESVDDWPPELLAWVEKAVEYTKGARDEMELEYEVSSD